MAKASDRCARGEDPATSIPHRSQSLNLRTPTICRQAVVPQQTHPRLRPGFDPGGLERLMMLPFAQSQHSRPRVSDTKCIANECPRLKQGPKVANLSGIPWGFKEDKTSFICARRIYYVTRCRNQSHCARYARVQIECADRIGQSFGSAITARLIGALSSGGRRSAEFSCSDFRLSGETQA